MKIRLLSKLEKPMLEKFRKPFKSLLFSIILFKIILLYKKEKKNEKDESDLNFRIVDEKGESIERLINVNCLYFLS